MRGAAAIATLVALSGCTATTPATLGTCDATLVDSSLVRTLRFASLEAGGASDGFDLDEHVSGSSDPIGCRHADFVAPDGREGIDNEIARLVPLIESQAGGVTLDSILETAINDGQLLIGIELLGVDDPWNDDCVTVRTRPLTGTPSLGTDGHVEVGQTFDAQPMAEQTLIEGARLVDGVVDVGPAPITIPVAILDARFTLHIRAGYMHIERHEDGVWTGRLGGGISIAEMVSIAQGLNIRAELMSTVMALLTSHADLRSDPESRTCDEISATLVFESVTAFVYD